MGKKDRRREFTSLIPESAAKVLDVGCAEGNLSAHLKQRGAEVIGIEKDKDSAAKATLRLSRVFAQDIEKFEPPYPKGYFECIIYGDILEHLIEPSLILERYRDYLCDGGYVIASVPNVRYYKIILRLLIAGTWDYSDGGILDRTHIRFFGLTNIRELFCRAGYEISEIRRNIVAARGFKFLNFLLFGRLKDFLTYQYYIKAKKSAGGKTKERKRYKF